MMILELIRKLGWVAILVLLMAACATPAPGPTASPLFSPVPSAVAVTESTSAIFVTPVPDPGKGAIIGRLASGSSNGPGYTGGDLYLGTLIPASDPKAQPMIGFSENVDPKAGVYNADGKFAFNNVAPGDYALVVWNPITSFVVELPNGGGPVKVKVEANKVTDLSTIVIP